MAHSCRYFRLNGLAEFYSPVRVCQGFFGNTQIVQDNTHDIERPALTKKTGARALQA
jgi:hypothetical protein